MVKRRVRSTPSVILAARVEEGQGSRKERFLDKFQELGQSRGSDLSDLVDRPVLQLNLSCEHS